ncbi:hypothetical protein [Bradyrhizobium sp. Ec3.3]|nr:hypothetical protein [Bradyrhizobium sp. Ec3.3]
MENVLGTFYHIDGGLDVMSQHEGGPPPQAGLALESFVQDGELLVLVE